MSKEFKKEVEKGVSAICGSIAFKKKQYYFIKPINENVLATLHFGIATHTAKGHILVNPTIGVSHKNIEELYAKLTGSSNTLIRTTIGSQIGYLMPSGSFKEWDFVENADNAYVLEDLLNHIQIYGFPYQERMRDFDNLFEAIEKRAPGVLHIARDKYLPILYYLKGDKQRGLKAIDEAMERQMQPVSEAKMEQLRKLAGPEGQIIIGGGIGKVDPEYLRFVENYKLL
jgi:hypothetical protein